MTCREAITCVVGCAIELQTSMLPEPDFTCFLDCEDGVSVGEALTLLDLTACVTDQCIATEPTCEFLVPTESSSDGGSSSSGGETTGTDTGTTTGEVNRDACLQCVLNLLLDPRPPGCEEFAALCI